MRFFALAIMLIALGFFFIGLGCGQLVPTTTVPSPQTLLWIITGGAVSAGLGCFYLRPLFNRCREANTARTRFP